MTGYTRRVALAGMLGAAAGVVGCGPDDGGGYGGGQVERSDESDFSAGSFLGQTPPSIESRGTTWFNADKPMTLKGLNGKIAWIQFGFLQ